MLLDRRSRGRTPLDPEMDLMYGLVPPKLYARFGSMLQMEGAAGGQKDNRQDSREGKFDEFSKRSDRLSTKWRHCLMC